MSKYHDPMAAEYLNKSTRKMSEKPDNPHVYPLTDGETFCTNGITLLDHFAGMAMQAITNKLCMPLGYENTTIEGIAAEAYDIAEAMLKEREKRNKQ